jgi:hypothetical protein
MFLTDEISSITLIRNCFLIEKTANTNENKNTLNLDISLAKPAPSIPSEGIRI